MAGQLPIILALGLALAAGACATPQTAQPPTARGVPPGEGFTNSRLRTALYEWSTENAPVRNACLQNSLVIFALLQECVSPANGEEPASKELVFKHCSRNRDGRSASFRVQAVGAEPLDVAVGFSELEQQFSLSAATPGAKGQ